MPNFNGLNIAMCQMNVVPGRPDINAKYIIDEIISAAKRGVDIIVFPEMCVTGYLIGDVFEDISFTDDVTRWNQRIIEATKVGITVIFGTVVTDSSKKGEDGRQRMYNAGVVARNGSLVDWSVKTLQPNYRFFNDDRHMYSTRKIVEEDNERRRADGRVAVILDRRLKIYNIPTQIGEIKIGVILCEDMWHDDYAFNPTRALVSRGANIIFNLSSSPWGWQKNRKRHQVVKRLLAELHTPFVYVNNTGAQNAGKNIVMFDGSSTIYDDNGDIIFTIPPYQAGTSDFVFGSTNACGWASKHIDLDHSDTKELFDAIVCGIRLMVAEGAPVLVGLSGGIDSAVVAALMAHVVGRNRVIAVNMPFWNSQKTQDLAKQIAENLGIRYLVRPIGKIVEAVCEQSDIEPHTLAYENVQARARTSILAGLAQKYGGFFTCNSNKVEMAFGYGTMHGDIAGFYAPLGDMVKREVRQIANYLNLIVFGREIIPQECITQRPSAELEDKQFDPFDYGDDSRRGYHDEFVRAITEFRRDPEWFIELYKKGTLEIELMLDASTLRRLFPTTEDFVNDLERWWYAFSRAYFKRIQCPPIPVYSRRAFGSDLIETLPFAEPHLTEKYHELKEVLLARDRQSK